MDGLVVSALKKARVIVNHYTVEGGRTEALLAEIDAAIAEASQEPVSVQRPGITVRSRTESEQNGG